MRRARRAARRGAVQHRTTRVRTRADSAASPAVPEIAPSYLPPQPTAHAICRRCGRILRVSIAEAEVATLQSFVDRRPAGWTVEGMSFSFTGMCPQCRSGATDRGESGAGP
ncbi:MAG: hypothetical protein L3J93_01180 [Thermoplasmata archaeon]|nr:hypothetical protein [Thermoplasmata archaeon]